MFLTIAGSLHAAIREDSTTKSTQVLRGKAAVFVVAFTYEAIAIAKVPAKKENQLSKV